MNKLVIQERLDEVEAQLDMVEKTWGAEVWTNEVPASVHEYVSALFRERNTLISLYRKEVSA